MATAGPTYTKEMLSASDVGRSVLVGATSSPGTVIHTADVAPPTKDEIWLYASVPGDTDVVLTIQFGWDREQDKIICYVPAKSGLQLCVPGFLLNNGADVRAYADVGDAISIWGFANRITP